MPLKTHVDEPPTLNLTAMLDVMFLLIIFFMLGTRFVDEERQIGLRVPEVAPTAGLDAVSQRKIVSVCRDGTISLDQESVTLDELTDQLAAARGRRAQPGRAGARRRPRRVSTDRRRPERLQAGRHQRTGHHRPFPAAEEVTHGGAAPQPRVGHVDRHGLWMGLLWLGLAAFTVALVVLIWTRWGQYQPLRKCLVLSLLAHLLLAGYATTVRIVTQPPAREPGAADFLH